LRCGGYEAPEGKIETIIAGIWADVLKVERVGRLVMTFQPWRPFSAGTAGDRALAAGTECGIDDSRCIRTPTPSLLAAQNYQFEAECLRC